MGGSGGGAGGGAGGSFKDPVASKQLWRVIRMHRHGSANGRTGSRTAVGNEAVLRRCLARRGRRLLLLASHPPLPTPHPSIPCPHPNPLLLKCVLTKTHGRFFRLGVCSFSFLRQVIQSWTAGRWARYHFEGISL